MRAEGSVDVPVSGYQVVAGQPTFAKSFHLVAHAQARGADNLLLDGGPIGNNLTPGDAPAPPGVVIGNDPRCNSTTDVLNDSICTLGVPVETKVPGPAEYRASTDGITPTSGSAVDIDVIRIPDRYFRPGSTRPRSACGRSVGRSRPACWPFPSTCRRWPIRRWFRPVS